MSNLTSSHKYYMKIKHQCFSQYTYYCVHCYEYDFDALCVDHINNDGGKQRRENPETKFIYRWLRDNNYPKDFQILCRNCNKIKWKLGGKLPEERKDKYKHLIPKELLGNGK